MRRLAGLASGLLLPLLLAHGAAAPARAASANVTAGANPVILVVDTSGSMGDDDGTGTRKIDGAKLALLDYVGKVEPGSLVGLRTYPDPHGGGCNTGKVAIPIGRVDPEQMSAKIRALGPDGDTPTAEAMLAAVKDLEARGTHGTLVILSDGEANCGDPCEAARAIRKRGIDLETITVGFRISAEGRKQLQCISDALGGRYLDIDRSSALRDTLDRLSRPRIDIALDGSTRPQAIAGGDEVQIAATVTNSGEVAAQDVIGQFTFEDQGADVRRPVAHLGNLAPHATRRVVWSVRAGPSSGGGQIRFAVVGRAVNASRVGAVKGTLDVLGITSATDAGAILKGPGRDIAIVGDSYSAGEGADVYDHDTDIDRNGCHRSPLTYLVPIFGAAQTKVFACSGAVTSQVTGPNADNKDASGKPEAPQTDRLAAFQQQRGPAKAVVMTVGGNDAAFVPLAASCIAEAVSCTRRVFTADPWDLFTNMASSEFFDTEVGDRSELGSWLESTYEDVNRALNSEEMIGHRGGVAAPILVLGYPLVVPLQGRTCAPMGTYTITIHTRFGDVHHTNYLVSDSEIDYVVRFLLRLNADVEAAVDDARRNAGVPVFYVPSTEMAFQPNHTLCESGAPGDPHEPFARSLASMNGSNADALARLGKSTGASPGEVFGTLKAGFKVAKGATKELVHPNARGYEAMTQAILRWTRTHAADVAVAYTKTAKPAEPVRTSWDASEVRLGPDSTSTPTLQGGTTYPLSAGGFAPASPVQIVVQSTPRLLAVVDADARGRVETRVGIPRGLEDGRHTLRVVGVDARGRPRTVRLPFEVDRPFRPALATALGVLSGLALLLGLALVALTGQLSRWRRREWRIVG